MTETKIGSDRGQMRGMQLDVQGGQAGSVTFPLRLGSFEGREPP